MDLQDQNMDLLDSVLSAPRSELPVPLTRGAATTCSESPGLAPNVGWEEQGPEVTDTTGRPAASPGRAQTATGQRGRAQS